MPQRHIETRTIEITEFAWLKIQSWGQALDEICFIAYGTENRIVDAIRMKNISSAPRNYFDYSKYELAKVNKKIRASNFEFICMGHSHPHKNHLKYPSKSDWRYLPRKFPQLIVFPDVLGLKAWIFSTTYSETLESSVEMRLLKK